MIIKDFGVKQSYYNLIEKKLFSYLWDFFYKPMFKIAKIKPIAQNENNIIIEALKNNEIIYKDGGFIATKKFSNKVAKELIKIGAIYDKYNKIYQINMNDLPDYILRYITQSQLIAAQKLTQINQFLSDIDLNLDQYIDLMTFDTQVKTILDDTGKEIQIEAKRIHVIEPDLSKVNIKEISENYTKNMQYYIKNWSIKRIQEMRLKVQKAILDGYREDEIQKMLQDEYHIAKNKAKFLARNETNIMLSEYKKTTYKEMGFDKFIWKTRMDGLERELHKELNNKIFKFDEPPIIDERTGQRGLPGETYNCRCIFIPYRDDNVFNGVIK